MSNSTARNIIHRTLVSSLLRSHGIVPITKGQWKAIKSFFGGCAYCGRDLPLTKEHLVGINDAELGTDHPSNIVPACASCQQRDFVPVPGTSDTKQDNWENHLRKLFKKDSASFEARKAKIKQHIAAYENQVRGRVNLRKRRKKIEPIVSAALAGMEAIFTTAHAENKKLVAQLAVPARKVQ